MRQTNICASHVNQVSIQNLKDKQCVKYANLDITRTRILLQLVKYVKLDIILIKMEQLPALNAHLELTQKNLELRFACNAHKDKLLMLH